MRRKRPMGSALAVFSTIVLAAVVGAQTAPVRVRMATALPEGTAAYDAWKGLEPAWQEAAAGASELRIYGGGSGDDEMLRRLAAGQLQAALLTLDGAARLEPGFAVLRTPLFVRTPRELDAVLDALAPALSARLGAKGYVLLGFAHVGWVRVFATRPLHDAADLKRAAIADWSADATLAAWWKARGYGLVALPLADVAKALGSGAATAVPATPPLALALGWFRAAGHMLDEPLVPALGVAVIQAAAWNRLDPAAQQRVRAAASGIRAAVAAATPADEASALAEMAKRGLTVERPTGGQPKAWADEAVRLQQAARGALVDAEILDLAVAARDRARSGG